VINSARNSIASAAPSLKDLKELSLERQTLLLLTRLHAMYPQMASAGGLIWNNLRMKEYSLALGYEPDEAARVTEGWTETYWSNRQTKRPGSLLMGGAGSKFFWPGANEESQALYA
jgi:hypothetical protein